MTRRAGGALEADVLRSLWNIDQPASPSDVIEDMRTDLAYTSIATIPGRPCDKGLAPRNRHGPPSDDAARPLRPSDASHVRTC